MNEKKYEIKMCIRDSLWFCPIEGPPLRPVCGASNRWRRGAKIRPGFLRVDVYKRQGRTFAAILHTLDGLGYGVEWQVLNSKDFGVAFHEE